MQCNLDCGRIGKKYCCEGFICDQCKKNVSSCPYCRKEYSYNTVVVVEVPEESEEVVVSDAGKNWMTLVSLMLEISFYIYLLVVSLSGLCILFQSISLSIHGIAITISRKTFYKGAEKVLTVTYLTGYSINFFFAVSDGSDFSPAWSMTVPSAAIFTLLIGGVVTVETRQRP